MRKEQRLTFERVDEVISYYPETGAFRWKETKNKQGKRPSLEAGARCESCIAITIDRITVRAHRLAWFLINREWPPNEVDHINCDPFDNRISNLRLADRSQNEANCKKRKSGRSGAHNVWITKNGKFQATIRTTSGGFKSGGVYETLEEAAEVAKRLHVETFGIHSKFSGAAA